MLLHSTSTKLYAETEARAHIKLAPILVNCLPNDNDAIANNANIFEWQQSLRPISNDN